MALSVNAKRLSKLQHTLNGISLSRFIYNFDYTIYKKICSFTPHQIYILSEDISWLNFIQKIRELYEHLYMVKNISQYYNVYKFYKQKVVIKTYMFDFIINIIDYIINQMGISQYYWFDYYTYFKVMLKYHIDTYLDSKNYMYYIASDIYDRGKSIQTLVNDIRNI